MSRRTKAEMRWRFAEETLKTWDASMKTRREQLLSEAGCEATDVVAVSPATPNRHERRRQAAIARKARRG